MNTVVNARITSARVGAKNRFEGLGLNVSFKFDECLSQNWIFLFCVSKDLAEHGMKVDKANLYENSMKALELMDYAGVSSIDEMVGKDIRIVLTSEVLSGSLIGFGHPTDDNRFFKCKGNFKTISMEEIVQGHGE